MNEKLDLETIEELRPDEVLARCREDSGLARDPRGLDDELLVALLRRVAGIHAPCSRATLRKELEDGLECLTTAGADLRGRIDDLIGEMVIAGDLLEHQDVTVEVEDEGEDEGGARKVPLTAVFAAPPTFVLYENGSAIIFGIVKDQYVFLSNEVQKRVRNNGCFRTIDPEADESLADTLESEGLAQIEFETWAEAPPVETALAMVQRIRGELSKVAGSGPVNDLEVIDPESKPTYYRGRWSSAKGRTGLYVGRRPREFGSRAWCVAEIAEDGETRLLDFPLAEYRWRDCDAAWHLQMAIDRANGRPQAFRVRLDGDHARFEFFSPTPLWAERRLMVRGKKFKDRGILFGYEIPRAVATEEERYLREGLWLERIDGPATGSGA